LSNVLPRDVLGKRQRACLVCILMKFYRISEMIASLKKQESESNYSQDLIKASKKLSKTSNEADIRVIVEGLLQKKSEDMYLTLYSYPDMFYFFCNGIHFVFLIFF
jgi:chromatin assembly factor 1 subunit A